MAVTHGGGIILQRMADEARKQYGTPWVMAFVAVVLFYSLSVGPASLLFEKNLISEELLIAVYYPFVILSGEYDWFESILDWYISLWTD